MSHHYENERSGASGPIPKRWLNCPRKSNGIIFKKFIAFKTPLSSSFDNQVPAECRFSPDMILGYCNSIKMKLGLWIDLTNTNRFYNREMIKDKGVTFIKLQCRGHGETPSMEQVRSFIEIVDNFIVENPLGLIGVHCTHGFNRTGFLIASYLVEKESFSIEAALQTFAEARAPGIYKQDYIDELFKRYGSIEDTLQAPELPDWCYEESDEEDESGSFVNDHNNLKRKYDNAGNSYNSGGGQFKKKRRREIKIENPQFMSGVKNVYAVTDNKLLSDIQTTVQEMCNWDKSGFPGCQPVSLNPQNVKRLKTHPYRVSWKADGARYMMLIKDKDQVYFIDRNNSVFEVKKVSFVKRHNLQQHLKDTLVDGEMVLDKVEGQIRPRYLIYDIIKFENEDIGSKNFYPDRLECIKKQLIEPRIRAFESGAIERDEPFGVRDKEFWNINLSGYLVSEKFGKKLSHDPDGLIYQPSDQPYVPGVCQDVFKWKPTDMNSIDFRFKIYKETREGMLKGKTGLLYVGGCDVPFGEMKWSTALEAYDNKIIECYLDSKGRWQFMRERTDKFNPNSYNTAVSVLESIKYPVTKNMLLDFIEKCGVRGDRNMMPPPTTQLVHKSLTQQQHQQQIHPSQHPEQYQQHPQQPQEHKQYAPQTPQGQQQHPQSPQQGQQYPQRPQQGQQYPQRPQQGQQYPQRPQQYSQDPEQPQKYRQRPQQYSQDTEQHQKYPPRTQQLEQYPQQPQHIQQYAGEGQQFSQHSDPNEQYPQHSEHHQVYPQHSEQQEYPHPSSQQNLNQFPNSEHLEDLEQHQEEEEEEHPDEEEEYQEDDDEDNSD